MKLSYRDTEQLHYQRFGGRGDQSLTSYFDGKIIYKLQVLGHKIVIKISGSKRE
jgi:hypothetical protein